MMYIVKNWVLIYLTLVVQLIAYSQSELPISDFTKKIDSLENILYNTSITKETTPQLIEVSNKLTELYSRLPFPQQIEYATHVQILTDKLNENSITIKLQSIIGNANLKLGSYETSIEAYYKVFNLLSISGDEVNAAEALLKIGLNYYLMNKYLKAKDYYERALDIFKKNQYFAGIAEALQSIALISSHWGEYDEALNYNFEALNFWKEIDNIFQIATVNYNIGVIYKELGDLSRAKECFQKSLNLFDEIKSTREVINTTMRIGDIYLQSNDFDMALEYYLKAELIGKQFNDKALIAETSFNLGKANNLIGDYMKAIDYLRNAIRYNEEQNNIKALTENYAELGLVFSNFGRLDQALFYLQKGLEMSLGINYKYQTIIYYKNLSEVYSQQGKFKEAFSCYKSFIEGKDLITSEESKLKTAELLAKYQVSVKDKENENLRHNEQLNNAQIKIQWLIIALVAFALLGLVIVSTIFRKRYKSNRKLNVQLSLKNREIEDHQKKVERLNADLQEANTAKDRFFSIIAHDLKNPFNSLMGLIELLIEDYDSIDNEERQEFLHRMKTSSDRIYSLLQNLLLWGSNQMGKTEVMKEKIDLSKIAEETITLIHSIADQKNISLFSDIPQGTLAFADKNMVSTILLNLITNAIKFTPKNGTVELHAFNRNNEIEVMVADSGVGISPENLEKLFRLDEKIQSDGTNNEKGTGLGLILCKEFIEKNNGKIWAESIEGSGSWFNFTLPEIPDSSVKIKSSPFSSKKTTSAKV
jgi:signal transduction histidine kinase